MSNKSLAPMSIVSFLSVARYLPSGISVLLRADHGVGKSQLVRRVAAQRADGIKRHFIDQRLSQKTEGDMIGLPAQKKRGDKDITRFLPPDWVSLACDEPAVILLDELNRATPEVMQAAFQLVLDRELNGNVLHKDTLVYACVNTGYNYTVNDMDPALLDRFFVVDLMPTPEDWFNWAMEENEATGRTNIHGLIYDFLKNEPKWLDTPKDVDPGSVSPSRRSWERFSNTCVETGFIDRPSSSELYHTAQGFLGTECAMRFKDFAKSWQRNVTGEQIVESINSPEIKKLFEQLISSGQKSEHLALIEKVSNYALSLEKPKADHYNNIHTFMAALKSEDKVMFWNMITKGGVKKKDFIKNFADKCNKLFTDALGMAKKEDVEALQKKPAKK